MLSIRSYLSFVDGALEVEVDLALETLRRSRATWRRFGRAPISCVQEIDLDEIERLAERFREHRLTQAAQDDLQRRLGGMLLPEPLQADLGPDARHAASLRVRLLCDERVEALPWEDALVELRDEESRRLPLSILRVVADGRPRRRFSGSRSEPLHVLYLAGDIDPSSRVRTEPSYDDVSLAREWDLLRQLPGALAVDEARRPLTFLGLVEQLREADALHVSCHGIWSDDDMVSLQVGRSGDELPTLSGAELVNLVSEADLRLVSLAACDSGTKGSARTLSLARQVTHAGVPVVIAMQRRVTDPGAEQFVVRLFEMIALGASLDEAIERARQQLVSEAPAFREAATPIVYSSLDDGCVLGTEDRSIRPTPAASPKLRALSPNWIERGGRSDFQTTLLGREAQVARIVDEMTWDRPTVVTGVAGIGKSALARAVAYSLLETGQVDQVIWLDASDRERASADLALAAEQLGITGNVGAARLMVDELPGSNITRLVVFDGAPSWDEIAPLLARGASTRTLLTARDPTDWRLGGCRVFPNLGPLDESAGRELLLSLVPDLNERVGADVSRRLHGHPLTIRHVAAYLDSTGMTYGVLERLDEFGVGALTDSVGAADRTLATIVHQSWATLPPNAQRLLSVIVHADVDRLDQAALNLQPVQALIGSTVAELGASMAALRRAALVETEGDAICTHPLVREVVLTGCTLPLDRREVRSALQPYLLERGDRVRVASLVTPWRGQVGAISPVYVLIDQSAGTPAHEVESAFGGVLDAFHRHPLAGDKMPWSVIGVGAHCVEHHREVVPLDIESTHVPAVTPADSPIQLGAALRYVEELMMADTARWSADGLAVRRPILVILLDGDVDGEELSAFLTASAPDSGLHPQVVLAAGPSTSPIGLDPWGDVLVVEAQRAGEAILASIESLVTSVLASRAHDEPSETFIPHEFELESDDWL